MNQSKFRSNDGYSLITILVIGLASALSLMAVLDLALSAFKSEAQRRYSIELRNAAEAGADYAINQLNSAAALHQTSFLDDGAPHLMPNLYLLSSGGSPQTNNQSALGTMVVTMTVAPLNPITTWNDLAGWSSIYSPSTDAIKSASTSWKSPPTTNILVDSWRILTVKAQYSLMVRYIRVILQPRYDPPPIGKPFPGTSQNYFTNPLLGNQGISFNPPTATPNSLTVQAVALTSDGKTTNPVLPTANSATKNSVPSNQVYAYPLTLTTNELASVGPGTDIKGNVQISSVASGQNPTVTVSSGTIEGTVSTNGTYATSGSGAVLSNQGTNIAVNSNVLADADAYNPATNAPPAGNNYNPQNLMGTQRQSTSQILPNQAPTASNSVLNQSLPAPPLNETGNALPDFTQTQGLKAGDYSVTTLDTSNTSQFPNAVNAGSQTGTVPVRIFVQDGTSSPTAIHIDSNILTNLSPDAANFQIWYSGNRPININLNGGGTFNGTIYAPNAPVTTSGSGNFTGAIVAGAAMINHIGNLNLRVDLANGGTSAQGLNYNYDSKTGSILNGYKPITWEEPTSF